MKIDFRLINEFISHIDNVIVMTQRNTESLKAEEKKLLLNSNTDKVADKLKSICNQLEEKLETAKKMKSSLIKIKEIYSENEKKISDRIECGESLPKAEFADFSNIRDNTTFDWRIN